MTTLSIQPPFPLITDIDGQPLEDGYIWIGTANLPPIGNPIAVYWDAALTIPAALPIRTRGGYPVNAGTPARLYVGSDYSILVQNKNGSTLYSAPDGASDRFSAAQISFLQAGAGAVVRTVQAKLRDVVSVKDFGAVGDGVTDDTAAIQAAVDYCFGSVSSPRGASSAYLNKALYFPAGRYQITSPIAFYAVWGAHIFGQGRMSTKITNAAGGNVFNMNGFGYSRIELLSLITTGATAKVINLDWDGVAPASTQQVTLADLFIEKGTSGGGVGIDIGASGFQASEILIQNCFITTPGGVGVAVSNYNALNVGVVQGNFQNCGYGIRVYAGSCPLITGVSFQSSANYDIQIDNHANDGYFISACRTESQKFINNGNNCPMLVAGCGQAWAGGGPAEFVRNSAVMIGCASNVGTNPSGQSSKRIGCTGSLTSGTSTVSFDFSTNRKGVQTVTSAVGVNLTLSQVTAGILIRAGAPGAPFTDNFPTAANFLQTVNLGGVSLGDLTAGGVFELRIINTTGQTQTIATADPNTTLVGNMTTAAGASHDFVIVVTGTGTTMTIYG